MAVRNAFLEVTAENTNQLEYTPPAGSAAFITAVFALTSELDILTLKIGNRTVNSYRIGPSFLNQALPPVLNFTDKSIIQALKKIGLPVEYPVLEGEKVLLQTQNNVQYLGMHFRLVDPGDVTPDMPNGRNGKERLIFIHGTNANDITESGWHRLDKCLNPPEMHSWPFEESACPFDEIQIFSIACPPYQENSYTGGTDCYATQKRVRIWKATELLLHPWEDGFITEGGGAVAGGYNYGWGGSYNELPLVPAGEEENIFIFPEPLVFKRGEEMAIEVKFDIDENAKVPSGRVICSLIGKVVKPE